MAEVSTSGFVVPAGQSICRSTYARFFSEINRLFLGQIEFSLPEHSDLTPPAMKDQA